MSSNEKEKRVRKLPGSKKEKQRLLNSSLRFFLELKTLPTSVINYLESTRALRINHDDNQFQFFMHVNTLMQ